MAVILGWLVPGLGHVLYGRKGKALFYFAMIALAFIVGLWLGEWRVVHRTRFPLYLIAQLWAGGPALLALFLTEGLRVTHDIAYVDVGLLFTATAGLLNVVAMVDVYEIHRRIVEGDASPTAGRAAEARL